MSGTCFFCFCINLPMRFFKNFVSRFISDIPVDFKKIEGILDYTFNNRNHLTTCFKHRSYLTITREPSWLSNERLEFLGDAVLDLVATEFLYRTFPQYREGELSKIKSVLVSRTVLAEIVLKMNLGEYLLMNRGEEKTGGKKRTSNLANLYEAIVGAIYLDGGYAPALKFIHYSLLHNHEELLCRKKYINYKSILLEYAQGKGLGTPRYKVMLEEGPDHKKQFLVEARITPDHQASGKGSTKKNAEQQAAHYLLKMIAPDLLTNP
jgi:ribonuclease-3